MLFYADLHVHSKYSRATSREADLEHLALWARLKGLTVVGTGDFTHPAWFEEIRNKLVPAEPGLFRLRPDLERELDGRLPPSCRGPVRFLLEVEVSTIYKKGDRTRKVHHLLYAASLETAARLREKLGAIGNLAADGRPILGLDSRHLLEITLASGPDAYLVPAHVWTPWFAALGSKSGFDSIEECYGDLAPHIFAIETGLSSDPPMNWRVSRLDRFTLVSSSDAHSPPKLGREASAFDTDLDYFAIRRALETGSGFAGTVEFFPEEGKYHLDGHRACGVRLEPAETRSASGLCPACGRPLTVGVLSRVEELADRPDVSDGSGQTPPPRAAPFRCLVPLPEVLSELRGVGVTSQAVQQELFRLMSKLGPEIDILQRLPLEDVRKAGDSLLVEALTRLRAGEVHRDAGYDGEYGVIRLFAPDELRRREVVAPLFGGMEGTQESPNRTESPPKNPPAPSEASLPPGREAVGAGGRIGGGRCAEVQPPAASIPLAAPSPHLAALDPEQRAAAEIVDGALLLVAGPGTGKTRTLTHRLAHLIAERGVAPESCLALTFSRRAAAEMEERLAILLPTAAGRVTVSTFHGLGLRLLTEQAEAAGLAPGFRIATPAERTEIVRDLFGLSPSSERRADRLAESIGRWRRQGGEEGEKNDPELPGRAAAYEAVLASRNLLDFDDLLLRPLALFRAQPDLAAHYRERFRHLSIDEYQDVDPLQYALVRLLALDRLPPNTGSLFAIGDPDQSIYRFRGAEVGFFLRFREDWPDARVLHLTRNYRSTRTLVAAACQAIRPGSLVPGRRLVAVRDGASPRVGIERAASERAEAELVVQTLERLVGGTSGFSFDSGRVDGRAGNAGKAGTGESLSFSDVAILYRTEAQTPALLEALGRSGIPFQKRSHRPLAENAGVRALLSRLTAPEDRRKPLSAEALLDRAVAERTTADPAERMTLAAASELLRPAAVRAGDDLERLLAEVTLEGEIDTWDPRAERVSLLTLHAAKGLEFPVVFLVGCEDGLLPLTFPGAVAERNEAALAEERRLFFVGITRARDRLFLFHSARRSLHGESRERRPSPYLADLEAALLDRGEERSPAARRPEQIRLL